MSSTDRFDFPEDQSFNLDFSTLDNNDVLENFDFDSFLNTNNDDAGFGLGARAKPVVESFYTISEDLAEGKLVNKERALKNLVKTIALAGFADDKPRNEQNSTGSLYSNTPSGLASGALEVPVYKPEMPPALPQPHVSSQPTRGPVKVGPGLSGTPTAIPEDSGQYRAWAKGEFVKEDGRIGSFIDDVGSSDFDDDDDDNDDRNDENDDYDDYDDFDEDDFNSDDDKNCSNVVGTGAGSAAKRKRNEDSLPESRCHKKRKAASWSGSVGTVSPEDDAYDSRFIDIIYMIHCPSEIGRLYDHNAMAYRDRPFFTPPEPGARNYGSKMIHPDGADPIFDIPSYFKKAESTTAITVVRHVRCNENQQLRQDLNQNLKWHESVAVTSPVLRKALSSVALCYYDGKSDEKADTSTHQFMNQLTISPLKLFLFHHQHLLARYAERHPSAAEHVNALLNFCEQRYGAEFDQARELFDSGMVTQNHLDKLYRPNDVIVSADAGHPTAYVLSKWPIVLNNGTIQLHCWNWRNNGASWHRHCCILEVPAIYPASSAAVNSLGAYPGTRYAPLEEYDKLWARGRKLWDLKDRSYVAYTGYDAQCESFYPESRFMVDYAVYQKMHEYASALRISAVTVRQHDPWPETLSPHSEPDKLSLTVMPHVVHGFYLTEKQWVCLNVEGVHDIKWNKTAYDRLVIADETKELIRALVAVRKSQRGVKHGLGGAGKRVDIIAGKGNGLIMLLHGGPGTGKSLTAESVAEIAEMPLYRVTCGDIGTTPEAVEKYMGIVMQLGVTWNCVLLLDEADVFLEERSMSDLARNSLVSVFLRTLEYYDGILILTSNRIGMFDEAFKSRIQVALHYEKLSQEARRRIWTNFVDMLEEDKEDVDFPALRSRVDDLARHDLNGRQIRNTLTTARQLALFQSARLAWSHLQQALSVSLDFNAYIRTMQGHTDDDEARDRSLR